MRYALINGHRSLAFPGAKGICEGCSGQAVAHCGPRVAHHWAHYRRKDCDPWWENKTQWHIDWQNLFPEKCQEVWHVASNGEQHRADIKTPTGIVIEVQHSAMSDVERISREEFYVNLLWIIDGTRFRNNFDIYHILPAPTSTLARELRWPKARRGLEGANYGLFFRNSENTDEIYGIDSIRSAIEEAYVGHHQYDWVRPHRTWLEAKCPVYIDFGEAYLVRMEKYGDGGFPCVRYVGKTEFLKDVMTKTSVHEVLR
jgi:hypothetical protein